MNCVIEIHTQFEDHTIIGGSTLIVAMPATYYAAVEGVDPEAVAESLQKMAFKLAFDQAAKAGFTLHHAEFVITRDPVLVNDRATLRQTDGSVLHDCPECQDGLNMALAQLSGHPEQELLVGQLFWAGVAPPSITCPRCRMVSYNSGDIAHGWCGYCNDWTRQ